MKIVKPDYKGGSIINLMSSIGKTLGYKHPYNKLKILDSKILKKKKIILIIIDGMAYNYLKKQKNSFLKKNIKGKMTSVFPSTTAAAMSSFYTSDAPEKHCFTGWFTYLKEIGSVATVLPFVTRTGHNSLENSNIKIEDIFFSESFFSKIKTKSFIIQPKVISNSIYSKHISKKAKILSYETFTGFFSHIKKQAKDNKKKFVLAYWPFLDSLGHKKGVSSKEYQEHFKEIDEKIRKLSEDKNIKDCVFLVTADHGMVDTKEKKKIIYANQHPKLLDCLTVPFTGEPRAAYCYVKPSKVKDFKKYIKENLSQACIVKKSEELMEENFFGLKKPKKQLKDRIGDYVLLFKENYILRAPMLGEKSKKHIANHGGVSEDEMFVPLVVIEK
jgi:hypothetical protein